MGQVDPGSVRVLEGSGSGLVAGPVFKSATETPSVAPVGSIPTRSRHSISREALHSLLFILALAFTGVAAPLAAQDTTAVPARDSARQATADTAAPVPAQADTGRVVVPDSLGILRVKPAAVLWRSLLVPGWGQAKLGRNLTAGFFIAAEALTLGMSLKANAELKHLRSINADSVTIDSKSQNREDWLVLLVVNHLLSGLEAYVSANLSDFPAELKIRKLGGGVSAQVAIPLHIP